MAKNGARLTLRGDNITQVRRRNRSMILELILREPGICRRDIVHETGLTAAAVSDITRELINEGLVAEAASSSLEDKRVGRSPVGLAIRENAVWAMGALVQREQVAVGISNLAGHLVFSREMQADCSSVLTAQNLLIQLADEAIAFAESADRPVVGMGVSIPGIVVPANGAIRHSSVLNWQDVKLVERLQSQIPYPLMMDNDIRGMALAWYWFQEQAHGQFLMVHVGNGIACCSVREGRIWAGNSGAAGQIGHSILDPNGPKCDCGQRGCFEAMVSINRLLEMIAEEIQNGAISSLDLHGVHAGRVKMARLYELIEKGDEAARGAYRRLSRYLGIGLSNLIKIYDPQALIISGDIFRRSKFAADLTKQDVRSHFSTEQIFPEIIVDGSPNLPLLGSATIALDRFVFRPDACSDTDAEWIGSQRR
ncbi:MAG: ROK family transcriptional regulator [Firmicutes bacterium]|nr:ROK family transcriptional regulator [Bacillota bacterium]